ncbi:hypothetical protein G7Y89_g1069 [Cudoniella acicularis]|uniref:Uncharacterized protein n=1 Tax=Cudoniella acicularis TaxID=354080 RepID=A0A8H4RYV9_9HELO|nr:hypothetical protein G7Y89_g1069 [Cudoniella acicularis]
MTDKYAKLKYESYRMGYTGENASLFTAPSIGIDEPKSKKVINEVMALTDSKTENHTKYPKDNAGRVIGDIPESSIDTNRLPEILRASALTVSGSIPSKTLTIPHNTAQRATSSRV